MSTPGTEAALLDLLPDGVLVADADGIVTHANTTAERMLATGAGLVGRPLAEAVALQDLEGRDWFAVTAPYDGLRIRRLQAEQSWYTADGTELLVTARFVRASPHDPVTAVSVALRSARARTRLDRERSDLVATVAHELRSPLTGVKGFTASLLARWDKFGDDQKRLIMETVHADTDRLTRLIAELLEVARIDTGRLSLYPRPVQAERTAAAVRDSIKAGTGRDIVLQAAEPLPAVQADPDRLTQVLTNLVENAVRHGEGQVRILLRETAVGDTPYVEIVVEDQGEGISPEIRSRVFTKFWKHGTRGGSGLGLYVVHGLVTAQGGQIRITDAEGGGARIEVLWPLAETGERSTAATS